jgi:hypothetical protein
MRKLKNIVIKDPAGKHKVFKHWKAINRGIYSENFKDKYFHFESDLISADNISRYDSQSNLLLYYIVHEFSLLLKYNPEGFVRSNICNFLVEFIDRVFFRYNVEYLYTNNDIKRFVHVLNSVGFLREIEEQTQIDNETQGFYEEFVDIEEPTEEDVERRIDDEEEEDAMDVENMEPADIEEGTSANYDRLMEFQDSY